MVSTRNHPSNFPPPPSSPSKALTSHSSDRPTIWSHTPTPLTLLWLIVSLPLVIWDTAYVMLRPHSMPDGKYQSPIFTPYVLYGTVDHIYGWEAYNANNGFTAAQASLNAIETLGYIGYLWIIWKKGKGDRRALHGGWGGLAVLAGFALSIMTLSKTVLYGLNEYFSAFKNIGHNDAISLIFLWIIPNGAWIVGSAYMTYEFAKDILRGLAIASGDSTSKPAKAAMPSKSD